ncbi:MAG: 4-hydroxy-2-oxovalerate aldolase [Alphaproteobacteria bacterium]|nr:4-hydroxy-2-oxovalerate aldolase [Alphaproteobacteria bacterium]
MERKNIVTDHGLKIMEVTLRDGSYAINFQFTAGDTALISAALEEVGFGLIEVGHGVGIGASKAGHGEAAESDETYMKATADALSSAKWGMFCIPGIADLDHIHMAHDYGMDFIRVGTNITEVETSKPFIEQAKKFGMTVCANFMKSYACSPSEVADIAAQSASYGADVVYLVDSAGGMLTEDVSAYVEAMCQKSNVRIGFHGHDNLGLSVANALAAIDAGATVIDTSLQGFGRSSGNTPTERFLSVLARRGIDLGMDPVKVMDIGEKYILPLVSSKGIGSLDVVCGLAQFHSSYMDVIREFSSRHQIDPRHLIIEVCKHDKINVDRDMVDKLARNLREKGDHEGASTSKFHFENYHGKEQG